jgi:hypothetical protein
MLEKLAIFGNVQPQLQPQLVAADSHRRTMLNGRCRALLFVCGSVQVFVVTAVKGRSYAVSRCNYKAPVAP